MGPESARGEQNHRLGADFFQPSTEKLPENAAFLPQSVEIRRLQVDHEAVGGFLLLTLSHERKVQ
jgi:hypothetical protein